MAGNMFALVVGETAKNPKNSLIGKTVRILRKAPNKKYWIKTDEGRELVWHALHLQLITKENLFNNPSAVQG